jgi:hypothetical protein
MLKRVRLDWLCTYLVSGLVDNGTAGIRRISDIMPVSLPQPRFIPK